MDSDCYVKLKAKSRLNVLLIRQLHQMIKVIHIFKLDKTWALTGTGDLSLLSKIFNASSMKCIKWGRLNWNHETSSNFNIFRFLYTVIFLLILIISISSDSFASFPTRSCIPDHLCLNTHIFLLPYIYSYCSSGMVEHYLLRPLKLRLLWSFIIQFIFLSLPLKDKLIKVFKF